jgi:hypothetical protein
VNVSLDQALLGRCKSHIHVIDVTSFQRDEFMTHGPHLNSRGQRKLTLLIPKRLGDISV